MIIMPSISSHIAPMIPVMYGHVQVYK